MARGGKRQGAGRRKGTTNRKIKKLRSVMREVAIKVGEQVPDAFEGDGVAFMVAIYKDPRIPLEMRLDAASKASRFERPVKQAVQHSGAIGSFDLTKLTDEQITRLEDILGPLADAVGDQSGEGEEGD